MTPWCRFFVPGKAKLHGAALASRVDTRRSFAMSPDYPCFIDIEATGFAADAYPIEVAWSLPTGEIHRCLISPETVPAWNTWSVEAERVHGIDRERLIRNGWPPDYVADRLTADLGGRTVYSDAPDYDRPWLQRLFDALDRTLPCTFDHVDELLLRTVRKPDEPIWQAVVRIDELKREIAALSSGKHAAGYDVGYLLALWRRTIGEPVKMNHGVGPLPSMTETGTFIRVKQVP